MNFHGEHLTADDEHVRLYGNPPPERPPIFCSGIGHRYEHDDFWGIKVAELCPDCGREDVTHMFWRLPEGVDL